MTIWAMANAPLYLGSDLTKLDSFGKEILGNDEVLAVDQSGRPAKQITAGFTQVWASDLGDGTFYVALFNLNAVSSESVWIGIRLASSTRRRSGTSGRIQTLGPSKGVSSPCFQVMERACCK